MSRPFWYPGNNAPAVSGFDEESTFRLVANGHINTGTNSLVDGGAQLFDAQQIGVGNGAVDPTTGEITNGGITSNLQIVGSNGANFLLSLENLVPGGLVAGDYTWTNLTVDVFGRITAATSGSLFVTADGGGGGALCTQTVGLEILGGKGGGAVGLQGINTAITPGVSNNDVTITLDDMPGLVAGVYPDATVSVDTQGRIYAIAAGGGGGFTFNIDADAGGPTGIATGSTIDFAGTGDVTTTLSGAFPNYTVTIDSSGSYVWSISGDSGGPTDILTGQNVTFQGGTDIDTTLAGTTMTIDCSYTWEITGDSGGNQAVSSGTLITIEGGTDITTTRAGSTITIDYVGLSGVIFTLADTGGSFAVDHGDTVDIEGGENCDTVVGAVGTTKTATVNVQATGGIGGLQYSSGTIPPRLLGASGFTYNNETLPSGGLQGAPPQGNPGWGSGFPNNNVDNLVATVPYYPNMRGKPTPAVPNPDQNFPSQYYGCRLSDWTAIDSSDTALWRCNAPTLLSNINKPYDADIKLVTVGPGGSTCGCVQRIVEPATSGGPILVQDWNLVAVSESELGAAPFGVALNSAPPGRTVACVTRGLCSVFWGSGANAPAGSLVQVALSATPPLAGCVEVGSTARANTPHIGVSVDGQSGLVGPPRTNSILVWVRISMFESY